MANDLSVFTKLDEINWKTVKEFIINYMLRTKAEYNELNETLYIWTYEFL